MTAEIITLADRRPVKPARLLAAAKAVLEVLETMPLDQLMEGADEPARHELRAAIEEIETQEIRK